MRGRSLWQGLAGSALGCCVAMLTCSSRAKEQVKKTDHTSLANLKVAEVVFDKGLGGSWQDWGWSPRDIGGGRAARINMANFGGWILANFQIEGLFAALRFHYRAPAGHEDFLAVRLIEPDETRLPEINVDANSAKNLAEGWKEVIVSFSDLNPEAHTFNRIVFRAHKSIAAIRVQIDNVVLLGFGQGNEQKGRPTNKAPATQTPNQEAAAESLPRVSVAVNCASPSHKISPWIYGIAYNALHDHRDRFLWKLRPPIRRWGGNNTSRYNWKLGNAWNTAADWFYENVNYTPDPNFHWSKFFDANHTHGTRTALTIPLIGWAAKDTTSVSFPVSIYGRQGAMDPQRAHAGNGLHPDGSELTAGSPTRTSVPMRPEDMGTWVKTIRARDRQNRRRSVHYYLLGNEPMLWNSTHRDIHPEPVTYDELLERTIAYGTAIRKADPEAVIAGPSVWGWPAYFFSAADGKAGFWRKPDRRAHGDVPLLDWYLQQLRAHEKRTGTRILDVVNVHFYPQGNSVYSDKDDPVTAALRIRSVRGLWDPTYKDESWIDANIELLPRLKRIIDENYPGLGVSIGEYNFGGEAHMSGALALAEALGRFGQYPYFEAAFYWAYPPEKSPAFFAMMAFRDYDHKGGRFLEYSLNVASDDQISLFASRNKQRNKIVAVVLNPSPLQGVAAEVAFNGCGTAAEARAYQYTSKQNDIMRVPENGLQWEPQRAVVTLPAYSITVVELQMGAEPK